jgi:hypothetical protein
MHVKNFTHTLAIVGNGLCPAGSAERIDIATRVARVDHAAGFGGAAGVRVDDLILGNRGSEAACLVADATLTRRPMIQAAGRIVLPFDPNSIFLSAGRLTRTAQPAVDLGTLDYTEELRERLRCGSRPVTCIDAGVHEGCCRASGLTRAPRSPYNSLDTSFEYPDRRLRPRWRPSSALVALYWYAGGLGANWRIDLYGFDLDAIPLQLMPAERSWTSQLVQSGRVQLINSRAEIAA